MRSRVSLLGTWIDRVDVEQATAHIADFVRSRRPHQVVTANVDFLHIAEEDPAFQNIVNSADLVLADGMPLVWASRRLETPLPCRVTGVDMVLTCAELAAREGYSIFLLGAAPGVADEVACVLRARFPGLRIAGTYAPSNVALSDSDDVVRIIREAQPDMLFVAFGAPKQEKWIHMHSSRLHVPVSIGVGGAFDMLAGRVRRAPIWMQRHGLEWFYRLVQEPHRLWKRYFVQDLPVFIRLMMDSRRDPMSMQPANPVLLVDDVLPDLVRREEASTRVG
jgi:N-acetylglucosaminyldiphosphoundecaprenol N-acetyl-beta-D-mannosaminyltransferase